MSRLPFFLFCNRGSADWESFTQYEVCLSQLLQNLWRRFSSSPEWANDKGILSRRHRIRYIPKPFYPACCIALFPSRPDYTFEDNQQIKIRSEYLFLPYRARSSCTCGKNSNQSVFVFFPYPVFLPQTEAQDLNML